MSSLRNVFVWAAVLATMLTSVASAEYSKKEKDILKPPAGPTTSLQVALITPATKASLTSVLVPATRVLKLQCDAEQLSEGDVAALLGWVAAGGSLWFSDSRMAHVFGMEEDPVKGETVTGGSWEEWDYGGKRKVKVGAALVYAVTKDSLVNDLDFERAFLLPVNPGHFSAVKATGDVVGLLRLTPAPDDPDAEKMVAAIRYIDKGMIVFKPVVSDGHFDDNLLRYVVTYVPGEHIAGAPKTGWTVAPANAGTGPDKVVTRLGQTYYGKVLNIAFPCASTGPETTYPKDRIQEIVTDIGPHQDLLVCRDGQRVQTQVRFGEHGVALQLKDGSTRSFERSDIVFVEFGVTGK